VPLALFASFPHAGHHTRCFPHTVMVPDWVSTLASIGMAVGPPLVYADQAASIIKNKDSTGFSRDVCAILWAPK
jgi:hypothetical protein